MSALRRLGAFVGVTVRRVVAVAIADLNSPALLKRKLTSDLAAVLTGTTGLGEVVATVASRVVRLESLLVS